MHDILTKKITILKKGKKRDKFTRCLEEITAVLTQINTIKK